MVYFVLFLCFGHPPDKQEVNDQLLDILPACRGRYVVSVWKTPP